jgi:hypothetical protein
MCASVLPRRTDRVATFLPETGVVGDPGQNRLVTVMDARRASSTRRSIA